MARTHGVIKPAFWTGKTGKRLRGDPDAQALAAYLMTGPHTTMIGIFYLPMSYIQHDLGMAPSDASESMRVLGEDGFAEYDGADELVWVPNIARDQVGKVLKPNDKRRPALMRQLVAHEGHRFYAAFVAKYMDDYLLDVKPLPGELKGLPPGEMPPYPVPVPDPVPGSGDPLLDFAKAWKQLTGRSDFDDYIAGGIVGGTKQQALVEFRKACGGSVVEFRTRVSARLEGDRNDFNLGQTLLRWSTDLINVPAAAPSKPAAPYHAPMAPLPDDGPGVACPDDLKQGAPQ